MAVKAHAPTHFDVTQVIGTVELGHGEHTPYVAAFEVIAEYSQPGTFTFPMENGQMCRVDVEYEKLVENEAY